MKSIRTVKISVKKGATERHSYSVALPKDLLKETGILIEKEGKEELTARILIAEVIEYKGKKAIVYYKP